MIESLSVTNFYCFKERTTISFTAKKERNRASDNTFCGFATQNKVNMLKLVYLLGNNGAGKSKILSAFNVLKYLVTEIRDNKEETLRHKPFAFDQECLNTPSTIELVYHISSTRYEYIIKWNKDAIIEESLKELRTRTSIELFHRWYDSNQDVVRINFMPKMEIGDNESYIISSSLIKNNSVISTVNNTNISHSQLKLHFDFFMSGFESVKLYNIDLNEALPDESTEHNKKLKRIICDFLKSVDTNIKSYEKLKVEIEYPEEFLKKLKVLTDMEGLDLQTLLKMNEGRHTVNTFHRLGNNAKSGRERLPLSEQSDGTKEILRLLIVLNESIENNRTIILDDYSSGIQRDTLNKLMKFFIGASNNSQLIISTQDYSLLDFEVVRRDSIRFLIKNEDAETEVKSIELSKLHKNSNLRHYVSKNKYYKQLPEMDDKLFDELLLLYKSL